MKELLESLQNNSAVIQVITTIIVCVTTIVLAWLTSKYVRLTKIMVDDLKLSREPSIYIEFEVPERLLRFTVGNDGSSSAINIKFQIDKDLSWLKFLDKNPAGLSSLPIIKNGISYLRPGRNLKFLAGYFNRQKPENEDDIIKVRVDYQNEAGKDFSREFIIDMSQYREVLFETFKDPSSTIADAIKRIDSNQRSRESSDKIFSVIRGDKRCPMCAEIIRSEANKCHHCGELLENKDIES